MGRIQSLEIFVDKPWMMCLYPWKISTGYMCDILDFSVHSTLPFGQKKERGC